MFLPGYRDLVRDQWVTIMEHLKIHGATTIPELCSQMQMSYMGVKQHCEALQKLGYLERIRVPRKEVGRPEVTYRLAAKADSFFPQAGVSLTLIILETVKNLYGQTAPEKILHQYFHELSEAWKSKLVKAKSLVEKATLLSALREKEGSFSRCSYDVSKGFRIEEYHHPLWALFDSYPAAILMEVRMMEQLLGSKIERREVPGGRAGPARVEYFINTI